MPTTIFVHPGYLRREDRDQELIRKYREDPKYGAYDEYFDNLRKLHQKAPGERIFFVQLSRGQLHPYMGEFKPRKNDSCIEWDDIYTFSVLAKKKSEYKRESFLTENGLRRFMQHRGIEQVLLAGEVGPHESSKEGCVGAMYSLLKDHFKVQGAKDCIFPLIPYRKRITPEFKREYARRMGRKDTRLFKEQERMFRDLYDEAVPLL